MTRIHTLLLSSAVVLAAAAFLPSISVSGEARPAAPAVVVATAPATAPATQPKELTDNVKNGIKWLIAHQNADGGWAQGEESSAMGAGMDALKEKSNVGDTCIAVLALLRTGSTPTKGEYAERICKGIDFVCSEIEKSPVDGLTVTSVNGTRIQGKLGPNIDTFLSSLLLGETRNKMPEDSHKRIIAALDKVMDKIEKNTKADGIVASGGWAGGIAQGIAVRGANVAAANGATVSEGTLKKFEENSAARQGAGGATAVGSDNAGVQLYAQASNMTAMENTQRRLDSREKDITVVLSGAPAATAPAAIVVGGKLTPTASLTVADKQTLQKELDDVKARSTKNGELLNEATTQAARQVQDARFISGFGSNGGEEFLSYLNLGESLLKKGGDDWKTWDDKMTANLNNIQNKDGSWSGQHCITGRTFCTSAALMVLMIDRENTQIGEQIKKR